MTTSPPPDRVEALERGRVSAHKLSWALRSVNRAAAEVDHTVGRRMTLRPLDYAAMGHIMEADGAIGPAELAQRLAISAGSATELVDRLERAGHVERRRESSDRRRVTLHASDQSVARILRDLSPLFASLDELGGEFDSAEQQVIERYLRGAAACMRTYADDPQR